MRRFSLPWYEHQLIQDWIPAARGVRRKLDAGARYADVGCGTGHALIKLAQTYLCSSFVGYDAFQRAIERARHAAEEAMRSADDPADNVGPFGTLLYGISVMYCMTTSLAHDGAVLGTCGCPPAEVRKLCAEAGFSNVRQLPLDNPFNTLYQITP